MRFKVSFLERKNPETSSIERVFESIGKVLSQKNILVRFEKLRFGNNSAGMLLNLLFYKPEKTDIYHITGHVHYFGLRLPKERTVLTIHDLEILRSRKSFRRYLIKKLFFDLPVKRLKYITVISENTKSDLVQMTNCPEEKITVIENPLTEGKADRPRVFNAERPTILQVGTSPNKNLSNLIVALRSIPCELRIIGPIDDHVMSLLTDNDVMFENRQNLSAGEMRQEYENADIVTFCSTSEGFGLPIIEAQAMMVPVVTSDLSPMKEVAGDGAILINPSDPEKIRGGILSLINNAQFREDLVKKGLENIARFSPERIAGQYEKLYERMLRENPAIR